MRGGVTCCILALLKTKTKPKTETMRTTQVTAEMYVNWVKDTYGADHYRKELGYLFDLLPDDAREAICDLVRADMPTRYEVITAGLWGCKYDQKEAAEILRRYLANVNREDISHSARLGIGGASEFLDELTDSDAETVLRQSFDWGFSPEGSAYWISVSNELEK